MKKMTHEQLVQLYIYNEISNWEWAYGDFVYLLVSEYNYNDVDYLLEEKMDKENFEKLATNEIEKQYPLDMIATDDMNNNIIKRLKEILVNENILQK